MAKQVETLGRDAAGDEDAPTHAAILAVNRRLVKCDTMARVRQWRVMICDWDWDMAHMTGMPKNL